MRDLRSEVASLSPVEKAELLDALCEAHRQVDHLMAQILNQRAREAGHDAVIAAQDGVGPVTRIAAREGDDPHDAGERRGQPKVPDLLFQHEQAGQMSILQDITKRLLRIDVQRTDVLWRNPGSYDQVQQASQQRERKIAGVQ